MIISLDCLGVKFGSISKITTENIVTENSKMVGEGGKKCKRKTQKVRQTASIKE